MPTSTNVAELTPLPEGYTIGNTWIVSVRILRNSSQYIYTGIGDGMCSVYIDNSNKINLVATADGVKYCAGQSVGVILAKSI